jgi:cytochrome o ubiquinol oxidase operon protein cyoD
MDLHLYDRVSLGGAMNLRNYIIGYVISMGLTVTAYAAVTLRLTSMNGIIAIISVLAFVQLVVQLIFFLHLGDRSSRWNRYIFAFMIMIVLIIVVGSLWIMANLNYHSINPGSVNSLI